jgi:hypothetical protein
MMQLKRIKDSHLKIGKYNLVDTIEYKNCHRSEIMYGYVVPDSSLY